MGELGDFPKLTLKELPSLIDYSVLRPEATLSDVEKACYAALKYGFAAVCVNSFHVDLAYFLLKGSPVKVCVTVGFPLGATLSEVKAYEAAEAVHRGAREVDFVINLGLIKSGCFKEALGDAKAVVDAVRSAEPETVIKMIIESRLLNMEEKALACRVAREAKVDYVKTCTGFTSCQAHPDDVVLLTKLAPGLKIKASGGIRTLSQVLALVKAGASRIGTSSAVEIMLEAQRALPTN
ncbi:MAG: deoxyribose-phosphate aldolase [Thermoprotei archaeon]|nr:MAG: deoxyribose-phosphate aldolase [Thermoprotei archaeon]